MTKYFLSLRALQGLLPFHQLENYSAYEILYTGASSITVKQSILLLQQICLDCGGSFIYFPVLAFSS